MSERAFLVLVTLIFLALALVPFVERIGNAQPVATEVGQPAPNFTLPDEEGVEHTLSDYLGQIVVLEWTSPECPFVQRHYLSRSMQETAEVLMEQGVVWLAIDSSHFNTPEDSRAWKAEMEIPYPILQDPEGRVGRLYGARTTPHMFIIDAEGTLRYRGAIDDDPRGNHEIPNNYVTRAVASLLTGEDLAVTSTDPYGCTVKYED